MEKDNRKVFILLSLLSLIVLIPLLKAKKAKLEGEIIDTEFERINGLL